MKNHEMSENRERKGVIRNTYKILVRKREGKRPHGKPRHRWTAKRLLLNCVLKKYSVKMWTGLKWRRI
jgi:hypothetical protein